MGWLQIREVISHLETYDVTTVCHYHSPPPPLFPSTLPWLSCFLLPTPHPLTPIFSCLPCLCQVRASTPMFLMSRKIKAMGVKMVLSGEGADEIFGGYLYFHKAPNAK